MKKLISLFCIILFLFGCSSQSDYGNPSIKDETQQTLSSKIKEGKTTQNQIKDIFGEPSDIYFDNGKEVWIYEYLTSNNTDTSTIPLVGIFHSQSNMDMNLKKLIVLFNNNKTVNRFSFSNSKTKHNYQRGVGL